MTAILLALFLGFPPLDPGATFKERWPAPFEELHHRQIRFQDKGPVRRYAMEGILNAVQ